MGQRERALKREANQDFVYHQSATASCSLFRACKHPNLWHYNKHWTGCKMLHRSFLQVNPMSAVYYTLVYQSKIWIDRFMLTENKMCVFSAYQRYPDLNGKNWPRRHLQMQVLQVSPPQIANYTYFYWVTLLKTHFGSCQETNCGKQICCLWKLTQHILFFNLSFLFFLICIQKYNPKNNINFDQPCFF